MKTTFLNAIYKLSPVNSLLMRRGASDAVFMYICSYSAAAFCTCAKPRLE